MNRFIKKLADEWGGPKLQENRRKREESLIGTIEEAQLSKIVRSEFIKERPERVNFERLMRYFELTPQIQIAVQSYSELISGTDMVISADNKEAKEIIDEWVRETDFYNKFEGLVTTMLICGTAIFEKLDTAKIADVTEVDMTSIVNKQRNDKGITLHYEQRQQAGQIMKLGEGQMDKFIEFSLTHYSQQAWGRCLFYSLAVARTAGNRTTAPLVEVMWGIEDAMGGIYQNNAYPITTITYPGANDVYLEKEAERWRRYKPGDKRVQKIKPEIEFFESQGSQSKFTEIITHMEKVFELGTQFPHDIMTGDFTSRASSETTETIVMKRVRGFQRYLCSKLKKELFEPILEQNGINTEEAKLEITFITQNIIALKPEQVLKLFEDKAISLKEVRDWYIGNTGMELEDEGLKDLIDKAEFQQDAQNMMNQNKFGQQMKDVNDKVERYTKKIEDDEKLAKLQERMESQLKRVKDSITTNKDEVTNRKIKRLLDIIEDYENG